MTTGSYGVAAAQEREDRGGFGAEQTPEQQAMQQALQKIPQHMRAELNILEGQKKKTVLEVRDFIAGEFDPLPLADLMTYLRAQEKAGTVKLTEQATAPSTTRPAARPAPKR